MTEQLSKLQKRRALQEKFSASLPSRLEDIETGWNSVNEDMSRLSLDHLFYRQIHSLAGSSGSFGYHRLGFCARELESQIVAFIDKPNELANLEHTLQAGIEQLLILADEGADEEFTQDEQIAKKYGNQLTTGSLKRIYVLEDDVEFSDELKLHLELFGYQAHIFQNHLDFIQTHQSEPANALLIDVVSEEGPLHGVEVASEIRKYDGDVSILFTTSRDDWQARLSALRTGSDAYLTKPIDYTLLIEKLEQLLGDQSEEPYRVVLIDDDPLLAEHYESLLNAAGIHAVALTGTDNLLQVLAEMKPDIMVMDLYLTDCTGIEAAQIIRQQPIYQSMPIIFLSTETTLLTQLNALRQGGDDFLEKPISDEHLIEMTRIYGHRFRSLRHQMTRDNMTGLLNHINFKVALQHEVLMAQRRSAPLVIAMIDIDHFKQVNDNYGHLIGDRVIKTVAWLMKQRLRHTDVIARYGGEEFAVILPEASVDEGKALLQSLLEQFSSINFTAENKNFTVTLSAGLVGCPPYNELDTIISAADSALYEAKKAGRNRVVSVSSNNG